MEPPPLPTRGTPLEPRQSPSKRPRAITTTASEPSLPPRRRPTRRAPPLKSTTSFMFTGVYPLYSREIIQEQHNIITIRCTQPSCPFSKVINHSLAGTNNYKAHYKNKHLNIPYIREQKEAIADKEAGLKERKLFFLSTTAE
jgi:hypothetical protein